MISIHTGGCQPLSPGEVIAEAAVDIDHVTAVWCANSRQARQWMRILHDQGTPGRNCRDSVWIREEKERESGCMLTVWTVCALFVTR